MGKSKQNFRGKSAEFEKPVNIEGGGGIYIRNTDYTNDYNVYRPE
jgi:hypothetical protein